MFSQMIELSVEECNFGNLFLPELDPCSSNPCQNGGFCRDNGNGTFSCSCKGPYTGFNCQEG